MSPLPHVLLESCHSSPRGGVWFPPPSIWAGFTVTKSVAGLMLSDFHQVTSTAGSQRRCSFCWFLQKPHGGAWATRKQLPASKPPCCEEAPTRPCRGIPWPSSETKPRAAWPVTSCCVHTHSPPCPSAPACVWRERHETRARNSQQNRPHRNYERRWDDCCWY